jgi:uncharacterized protein YqjF (DUF2071 family)
MVDLAEYEALRHRPPGRATMRQSWRDLSFLHISADPAVIQSLLPEGLEIDTFDERAWVGLVPFHMKGIRPTWAPAAPWLSAFPETNVRTYVHRQGKRPGVWFFSLDAARWLACRYARLFFSLPYFHAHMNVGLGEIVEYRSRRPDAEVEIDVKPGPNLPSPEPGSLEFFLIERYLLYTNRQGRLYSGQVYHPPYPLKSLEVLSSRETLFATNGIASAPWEHACFSPGVDVEVFSVEPVS